MGSFIKKQKTIGKQQTVQSRLQNVYPGVDRIAATPHEAFGKLGNPNLMGEFSPNKICAIYRDIEVIDTPLPPGGADRLFGVRRIFNCGAETLVDCNRITDLSCGAEFEIPFVLVGIAAVATGEFHGFTMHGVFRPLLGGAQTGPAACPVGPPELAIIASCVCPCDDYCGAPDLLATQAANPTAAAGITAAHLQFGKSTWIALQKILQVTELQFILRRNFILFRRPMSEMIQSDFIFFEGAGEANVAPTPAIRYVNEVLLCGGVAGQFVPVNAVVDPLSGATSHLPVGTPSQLDGGLGFRGVGRFCPLAAPVLICPGIPVVFQFNPTADFDPDCLSLLRENLEISQMTPSADAGGSITGFNGTAQAQLGVQTTIPGGQIKLGIVLFGFELYPECVLDFVLGSYPRGAMLTQTLRGVPWLWDQMNKEEQSGVKRDKDTRNKLSGILGKPGSREFAE